MKLYKKGDFLTLYHIEDYYLYNSIALVKKDFYENEDLECFYCLFCADFFKSRIIPHGSFTIRKSTEGEKWYFLQRLRNILHKDWDSKKMEFIPYFTPNIGELYYYYDDDLHKACKDICTQYNKNELKNKYFGIFRTGQEAIDDYKNRRTYIQESRQSDINHETRFVANMLINHGTNG